MRRRLPSALLVLVLAGSGCGEDEPEPPISRETFVEVMVDLRRTSGPTREGVGEDERDRILERHGVTAEELVAFARIRGGDPDRMEEVWEEIQMRLTGETGSEGGSPAGEDPTGEVPGESDANAPPGDEEAPSPRRGEGVEEG